MRHPIIIGGESGLTNINFKENTISGDVTAQKASLVATNLTLQDTLDLNIAQTNGTQNIHEGTITLFANNGFPFDAQVQMYLLNESNAVTDSIFGYANTIVEAPINAALRVIGKKLPIIRTCISYVKINL